VRDVEPDAIGLDLTALAPFVAAIGPFAVVDFETTGLPEEGPAEPIEVGAVLVDRGRSRTFESRIRPRGRIPRAVTALTGLSDADLAGAPRIEDVAPRCSRRSRAARSSRTTPSSSATSSRASSRLRSRRRASSTRRTCSHSRFPTRLTCASVRSPKRELGPHRERTARSDDALDTARLISRLAEQARAGGARASARAARSSAFAPDDPWAALLAGARPSARSVRPIRSTSRSRRARAARAVRRRRDRRGARRRGAWAGAISRATRVRAADRDGARVRAAARRRRAPACSRAAPAWASRSPISPRRSRSRPSAPRAACAIR
jgi:hypothetical protein